ncbi:MAG: murein L,D-transpeptidase [Rhizobiales bacterium 65-9]|nr:L,D-transpeptidase family protein [Hyphomicrobiales bacterium]OJY36787.1 MAG: murein L,D-transpeptidase [Rhizobiales bacterium 65-9]
MNPAAFPHLLNRRSALRALASTALASQAAATAWAQAASQAEWSQSYDGVANLRVTRNTVPLLSEQTVHATEQAIEKYRTLAATGYVQVPAGQYRVGSRGPGVTALRRRLAQDGDLTAEAAGESDVFDSFVEAGVRRFQQRHGLNPVGVANNLTLHALNVPAETRLRQLEVNLVRLRTLASGGQPQRYIATNIPAAQIETVENGVVQTHHQAVVGKPDRQSPILTTRIPEINFHPYWTTPASIIRKDLIPKMRTEPNYLTENRIRIFNGQGQEVPATAVNWNSPDDALKYRFRQDPGDFNSMGTVRINVPSPHGVYMHDTNSKGLFGDDARFHSSGCIRVQNVRDYVAWILKNTPGMTREKVEELFRGGQRVDVKVADPVQLYWVYITAWGAPDGVTQFREDIYNKDGLGKVPMAALQGVTAND